VIDLQDLALGVQSGFDILEFESFANLEPLFQNVDIALGGDQTDKGNLTCTDGDLLAVK